LYLSKLEIFGFKSFANKTVIHFTKGITGIVGPNGCGKTNIVDAIRWCLGEQKSSTLRSDKMENVIFNGTRSKKPMGMSEVSLTLVNDDNKLPTEYSEVTITRRIFRSGESEYLLNKNLCRLKDITNLFMDTGMGTNAYSVIELKMIETILNNKAEERRKMFEEAAGVNKYKLRRRLSLKKLEEVKSDLTRVNDIVAEVEKNVRSLERQAKKADKYNQYQTILREKEIDLSEREYSLFTKSKKELEESEISLTDRKAEIDNNSKTIEERLDEIRSNISEVERNLYGKRNEISALNDKIYEKQKTISVSEERMNSLESNIDKYKNDIEDFQNQIVENEETIRINKDKIEEFLRAIESKEQLISENSEKIESSREEVNNKRSILNDHRENSLEIYKILNEKENKLKSLQGAVDKAKSNVQKLNDKIQTTTNDIAKTVGYLEELSVEKEEEEKKYRENEKLYNQKQEEKENLEKKLASLKEKELKEKGLLNDLKNKIEFLQTLLNNLEGVSKGSKSLIQDEEWTSKEKTLIADVGEADDKYKFALEAALVNVLNDILIHDIKDLNSAIKHLKDNELGKASFYLMESENNGRRSLFEKMMQFRIKRKIKKLEEEKSFVNWASKSIKSAAKWKPYFKKILFNTVIVNDFNSAVKLHSKYRDFDFVSLNGDLIKSNGEVVAGSAPQKDQTILGRKKDLELLNKEYPVVEGKVNSISGEIKETETVIAGIDLKTISDQSRIIQTDLNNIDKQISQLEFEKKKYDEEIEKAQNQIKEFIEEENAIYKDIENLQHEFEIEKTNKSDIDEKLNTAENNLKEFENHYNKLIEDQNSIKVDLERSKGLLENSNNSIKSSNQNIESIKNNIQKRNNDITNAEREIEEISGKLDLITEELEENNEEKKSIVAEATDIENELKTFKAEASNFESDLKAIRKQREEISDRIHNIDIKISEANFKLVNIQEHIKENYAIDITYKEFDDLDTFNFDERKNEVHGLKEKIKNLGPINSLAYTEFEEEKERMEFLQKQRNDLIESEKDLVKTIGEINETAQKLFMDTFAEIRQNFIRIFQTLFNPGDEADLNLEEDKDPLEAKIEIMAKPKGKRPTSIELLSGGEKTLTATALLFAIYLVKPSPFCILDEVDAPLDDANIDRFTKLLKEFSKSTQFIIVTHNKRTMESGQNLYGVTMQEEGISKLAAVQFNEEVHV
jgi:chromosome segregation protein